MPSVDRCAHGVDPRIGSCADCEPDKPLDYTSFAPRRAPYVPDRSAIEQAARTGAGSEAQDGDLIATVTFKLRRGEAPEVTCSGPLTATEARLLHQLAGELPMAVRALKPIQWYDPTKLQDLVTQRWMNIEANRQRVEAEKLQYHLDQPFQCRWCQREQARYKTDRGRRGHESRCNLNPDNWFKPGAMVVYRSKHGTSYHLFDSCPPDLLEKSRRLAERLRAHRAPLFEDALPQS